MFAFNFNNPGVYVGYNIYIFGGKVDAGTSSSTIQKHKPTVGTATTQGQTLASASYGQCSGTLPGGSAYIFGGKGGSGSIFNTIQKYTGSARTTEASTLAAAHYESSCTPMNTNLYIFGGWNDTSTFNTIQKWSGSARTTESYTNSYLYIRSSAATLNDKAYIFSGGDGSSSIGEIHKYDGTGNMAATGTGTWAGWYNSAVTLGTKIYHFKSSAGTNVASYDGTTWSSSVLTTTYGIQNGTAQTYDNSIYLYGGSQGGTSNGDNDSTGYDSAITRYNTTAFLTLSYRLPTDVGFASSAAV